MESVPGGTPAPYGRACTNCSKAKCKCTLRHDGGACERCHRLNKTCQPAATIRKRPRKQANNRTAHLEKKLDHLADLLRASGHENLSASLEGAISGDASPTDGSTTANEDNGVPQPAYPLGDTSAQLPPLQPTVQTAGGTPEPSLTIGPEPTPVEAEILFNNFREENLRLFPFVKLSRFLSARQLRQEYPFLWLCIMAIATRSRPLQLSMGERIRAIVARKLILEHERSMDLLLGLVAFMAWANVQPGSKPFFCIYTQLAVALVYDLGLTKELSNVSTPLMYWKSIGLTTSCNGVLQPRSMEERRTVLAVYLMTGVVASFVKKMEPLRWTRHMEECLCILEKSDETPNDHTLIAQVRMQLIYDEAINYPSPHDFVGARGPPPNIYIKALHTKLQTTFQALSPEVRANGLVACKFHDTELAVHESAISHSFNPTNFPNVQRLEALYTCLNSIKSWFDLVLDMPPKSYPEYGLSLFAQISHCCISLHRLQTLDDPIWDLASARAVIDLPQALEKLAARCATAADEACNAADENEEVTFIKAAKMLRRMKGFWEKEIAERLAKADRDVTGLPTPATHDPSTSLDGIELGDFDGELLDDEWFAHVFAPMEF